MNNQYTGKADFPTWKESEEQIDDRYRYGDKKKFLTNKYRKD